MSSTREVGSFNLSALLKEVRSMSPDEFKQMIADEEVEMNDSVAGNVPNEEGLSRQEYIAVLEERIVSLEQDNDGARGEIALMRKKLESTRNDNLLMEGKVESAREKLESARGEIALMGKDLENERDYADKLKGFCERLQLQLSAMQTQVQEAGAAVHVTTAALQMAPEQEVDDMDTESGNQTSTIDTSGDGGQDNASIDNSTTTKTVKPTESSKGEEDAKEESDEIHSMEIRNVMDEMLAAVVSRGLNSNQTNSSPIARCVSSEDEDTATFLDSLGRIRLSDAQVADLSDSDERHLKNCIRLVLGSVNDGDWANVVKYSNECLEIVPTIFDILKLRGMAHEKLGNTNDAMVDFDVALTLSPSTNIIKTLRTKVDACMKTLLVAYVRDFVKGKRELLLPRVPSTWATWSHNEMFRQMQLELQEAVPLKQVATKYGREFCPYPFWGCDEDNAEIVAFIHFAVEGQGAHLGYPEGVPGGYAPNSTMEMLFSKWAMILSTFFGIPLEHANAFTHQKIVVFDALPIDGPADQASKPQQKKDESDNAYNKRLKVYNTYKTLRKEADKHSLEFIEAVFKRLKNAKLILVYSREAYDLITANRHIIPDHVQILQVKNVIHPCTIAPGFPYRQTERAVEYYIEAHIQVLASYFGVSPDSFDITPGKLHTIIGGNNIIKYSDENYQLWEGEPGTEGAVIILQRKVMEYVKAMVPIGQGNLKVEVGKTKKIKHSSLTKKNNEPVGQLYLRVMRKTPGRGVFLNGEDYMAENTFPLTNATTEGKTGTRRGSKGGKAWGGKVALYYQNEANNNPDTINTEEDELAAVVCNHRLASALMGRSDSTLKNLEQLVENKNNVIHASDGTYRGKGYKFAAVKTELEQSIDCPKANKLPFPNRYVHQSVFTRQASVSMLEIMNAYHDEYDEWKYPQDIPEKFKNRFKK